MTPGTNGPDRSDPLIGRELGDYRLEEPLGAGVNGRVYRARRIAKAAEAAAAPTANEPAGPAQPEVVAIKVLLPDEHLSPEEKADLRRRLLREAETLGRLHHPNILSILAVGPETDELTYLVLPYMANGTLASRMSLGTLPFTEVARIITQIASALDYAHGQGVIHRDIKPQNILIDDNDNPLLADFGLVRLVGATRSKHSTTRFGAGTPVFMSPEQIQDQTIGAASDIYSLGVVAFQMVTGRLPFESDDLFALMNKIVTVPPPLPRSLRPDLPEPAEAVIWQAIDKQPGLRFGTATAFGRALAAGLNGQWDPEARPVAYAVHANSQPGSLLFSRASMPSGATWPSAPPMPPPQTPLGRGKNVAPLALGALALVALLALVLTKGGLGAIFNPSASGTQGVGIAGSGGHTPTGNGALTPTNGDGSYIVPPQPTEPPQPTAPPGVPTYTPYPTYTPFPTVTPGPRATATPRPTPTRTPTPQPHVVNAYDNYGQSNLVGHAMCRGNPGNSLSMPGGTGTQTFTVPSGVVTLNSAKVQIDPASVTGHMSIAVNGHIAATTAADAVGDTIFSFGPVTVHAGDVVTLSITFTATYGKIITLYTVGNPGGTFTASNSCPDGAPNYSSSSTGLRAVVSGMS